MTRPVFVTYVISLSLLLLALIAGCTAPAEESPPSDPAGDRTGRDPDAEPRPSAAPMPSTKLPPTLQLAPTPGTTAWTSLPLEGRGPGMGTVVVEADSGSLSVATDSFGEFCADIALLRDRANRIRVRAIDLDGQESAPIEITITQDGEPGGSTPSAPSSDVAQAAAIALDSLSVRAGSLAALVDDSPATTVDLGRSLFDFSPRWIWLRFATPHVSIAALDLESDPACPLSAIQVFTADQIVPGLPGASNTNWGRLPTNAVGQGTLHQQFPPRPASHLAINLGAPGCYHWWWGDMWRIGRIAITTAASSAAPAQMAQPMCGDGGPH